MDNRDLDITGKLDTKSKRQDRDLDSGRWCSCVNCGQWSGTGCYKAGGVTPPVRVIVLGCPSWEMDIPF